VGGALVGACLSFLSYPLYRARPKLLLEPASWLVPPALLSVVAPTLLAFAALLLGEAALRKRWQRISHPEAFQEALRSYSPVLVLLPCLVLLVPGAPGVPPLVSFLVLDALPFLLTLALGGSLVLKLKGVSLPRTPPRLVTAAALGLVLFALMPGHRIRQPYDERFGTGDEPRYVRIAASLLHDGDADVSNAAEHVARPLSVERTLRGVAALPGAVARSFAEAGASALGRPPQGEARPLGGQVVSGRRGGEFYVYLPGFPLLLTAPMALDALAAPGHLYAVIVFCLALAVVNALALERLGALVNLRPIVPLALASALAVTPPLAAYSFQVYPEVAASIALSVSMLVVLRDTGALTRRELLLFACGAALLPWLHTKYYPLLGAVVVGFLVRHRHLPGTRLALALAMPALALAAQSLYVFEITGSFLPDSLWVLNGYPRGAHLFNTDTLRGLYYLFLGRSEGLFVYAPYAAVAGPGLFAIHRKSRPAFWLCLVILVPYVLAAASHDQGGAGGWSPPARYFVPVMPVFTLALSAWLAGGRSSVRAASLAALLAASFWIGVGMLQERNFLYDRAAFRASGAVDPSPFLGSSEPSEPLSRKVAYPAFLAALLLSLRWAERKRAAVFVSAMLALAFVAGSSARLFSHPSEWTPPRDASAPLALRPGRVESVLFRSCSGTTLRFHGGEAPAPVHVSGIGFGRSLVVPSSTTTELSVEAGAFREWTREGRVDWTLLRVRSDSGRETIRVEPACREEGENGDEG
jgi:hypothetical protein